LTGPTVIAARRKARDDDCPVVAGTVECRAGTAPSRKAARLDWFIFFLADVQTGLAPLLRLFDTQKWTQVEIGLCLVDRRVVG